MRDMGVSYYLKVAFLISQCFDIYLLAHTSYRFQTNKTTSVGNKIFRRSIILFDNIMNNIG